MTASNTRQALYDRIRDSSTDEVILEEMIRLGFWAEQPASPEQAQGDPRRRLELERELRVLISEQTRLQNIEAMRQELRCQRLEESRRKQQKNRERREQERQQRATAWQQRKTQELLYLGEDVSTRLNIVGSDRARLIAQGLPVLDTPLDLAHAMGIDLGELRFLAFHRPVSRMSHYIRFKIPKKSGGERLISAPMPRLKRLQHWINGFLLAQLIPHPAAHGFQTGRSIVTNAQPHVGSAVVINADFRDFFPTISYPRVWGLFHHFGYAPAVATVLALLCTEADTEAVDLDGERYFVAMSERQLPQGSPASPTLSNLICRRLDRRLTGIATKLGYRYTRYADDLTFSHKGTAHHVGMLLRQMRFVSEAEGFELHPDKVRVMRASQHQEVTGLTVNQRLSVARPLLRRFRATLYQIEKDSPTGKRWGHNYNVLTAIGGFANFVAMVDPTRGTPLRQQVAILRHRFR